MELLVSLSIDERRGQKILGDEMNVSSQIGLWTGSQCNWPNWETIFTDIIGLSL